MLTINVPIFDCKVCVITDRKQFTKVRAKFTKVPFDAEGCVGCSSDYGYTYLVGVFDHRLSTLVHELAHTTFKILRDCNIPANVDGNQEAFCYLQDWLFSKSIKAIK